ncbi:MAG: hypothetical protein AB2593_05415 [Candidatus Thiodiazotropha sp.]|nr:hypothetical protein [Candidatus Thiodiazotropha taylori]MBT3058368.1 hypothetical protein [Candidatus Thiodiazotropha sp. (ex Lucina pensylvanica)]MBV2096260.1 hypothetical protein [Candidatus Thiodiazotropha sp. (ex Codakia orbicularis)]PUB72734.1 MAG: hypothetical protein DBP03_15745 [gamma proteobacterium symbiont of Ctena orbiculata]PUB78068.1 MAG: hypothetical protein DBO99_08195 [gamma proteobacterium symbiont of Ctena orbiculata]
MCTAVHYTLNGREFRTKFPDAKACLPVKNRHGGADLLPWGRRRQQLGRLPLGGWARLDAIYGGRWDRWRPIPVKLLVSQFMEVDMEGRSHWFDVTPGKWIQGLVAHWERERRVYVVTITPEMEDAAYERWPRILSHNTTADIS